jgi:Zn-dependent peptidase ImmA (M78 family)/DNA-binding XRE family transcriptional regulator
MMMADQKFEPKRLRLARTFLGIVQGELGETVGASRQFIHQLESGQRTPSSEMAAALGAALLVEPSFFFRLPTDDIPQDSCNFRSLASSRVRDLEQVISHGAVLKELLEVLEEELEFPTTNFPRVKVTDVESVERAAERARVHWKLTTDQPITSTIRVAENAGAVVVKFPGVAPEIDALSVFGERPLIIRSSEKENPTRLRFDIAHEIGHLVMHRDEKLIEHEEMEKQAHRFASAFLLPRKAFLKEFPRGRRLDWQAIFAIKRNWNVSAQAILRRALDLQLIDAAQYRSGCIFISKQGFKRNEPYEPSESEKPETLRTALITLQQSKGLLPKDVAHRLAVQPVLLGKLLGLDIPDLTDADARTVVSLNARLDWAKAKWMQ